MSAPFGQGVSDMKIRPGCVFIVRVLTGEGLSTEYGLGDRAQVVIGVVGVWVEILTGCDAGQERWYPFDDLCGQVDRADA